MVVNRKKPGNWIWRIIIFVGILFWVGFGLIRDLLPEQFMGTLTRYGYVLSEFGFVFIIIFIAGVILLSVFGKKIFASAEALFKGDKGNSGPDIKDAKAPETTTAKAHETTTAKPPSRSYDFSSEPGKKSTVASKHTRPEDRKRFRSDYEKAPARKKKEPSDASKTPPATERYEESEYL